MASIPEINAGKVTESADAMPVMNHHDVTVKEALGKIMEIAEEDPNADSYYPEDEEVL